MTQTPTRTHYAKGLIRGAKRFAEPALAEIARSVEERFQDRFAEYDADFRVLPIRVTRLRTVGDGMALDLAPHDAKTWDWWGDFESDIEVRRRRRFSRTWEQIVDPVELTQWLDAEAREYLAKLDAPRA
jgi:hypothetical protein